jgi:integrase
MPVYRRELQQTTDGKHEARWQAYIYDRAIGRNRYLGTFRTKTQAKDRIKQEDERIRLGRRPEVRRDIGFSDLVKEWMEIHVRTLRESTRHDYANAARYLTKYFGNRPVSAIERRDVALFVSWLCKQPLGAHSVRKIATRLSQVLNFAIELEYITTSPTATGIKNLPSVPKKRIDPLTPQELWCLINALPEYWRPLVLLMATAGLRRSEAFGVTVRDADLENGELHVRKQLIHGKLLTPKTQNAIRVVPLPPTVVEALKQHLMRRPANELDLVFPTESGCPVDPNDFRNRVWVPAVRASGIERRLTMHDLRRTYGSMIARHGRSAAYLQATMGHSSARTSLTYYVGIYGDEQRQAVADVEKWIGSEGSSTGGSSGVITLEIRSDFRNTTENEDEAA